MPTNRHRKVRLMLRSRQAKVVKRCPFTIQLLYQSGHAMQPVSLGIDAGSKHIGTSATTETHVLYESDVELRSDIVDLLSSRREMRRTRRNRKTRYRKPRFDNRKRSETWLAPSIREKIDTHLTVVRKICEILPVTDITVETASFDIQKIKNPDIQGKDYQHGEQFGFWNAREYVLFRDGHECQCCHGKSKDKILNVHHIESRKTGGNAPNNLITLCETCHTRYHQGTVQLPKAIKRGMRFRDAAFMGIMRWAFYAALKEQYAKLGLDLDLLSKTNDNRKLRRKFMEKDTLRKQLLAHGVKNNTAEIKLYIPSVDELLYMQVGDGSQLDKEDGDEEGIPYDNYIDYTQYAWSDGTSISDIDGGIFAYHVGEDETDAGELISNMYDLLLFIYGDDIKKDEFQVQVLGYTDREYAEDAPVYEVTGVDELEDTIFALCTSKEKADKAKQLMVDGDWDPDMLQVYKSNLALNQIILDNKKINL